MPRSGKVRQFGAIGLLIASGFAPSLASAANIDGFAIFAGQGVSISGNASIPYGGIGSNANVTLGSFSNVGGTVEGGGDFNSATQSFGNSTIGGPLIFNGSIYVGGSETVNGSINAGVNATFGNGLIARSGITTGGSINTTSSNITGDVRSGGDLTLPGTADIVNGNVLGNWTVNVQGTVNGNVTYGTMLTTGTSTHINGTTTHSAVVANPLHFTPQVIPAADPFISGGANVTNGGTATSPLAPGSYGDLGFTGFSDLYLGPGNYYFNSLNFNGLTSLHLVGLTAATQIHIYSKGDISGDLFFPSVNGVDFTQVDPMLARNVSIETLQNYSLDHDMFGSIFAPNGSITMGSFHTIYGNMIAGQTITTGSITVLPEPGCVGLLMAASGLMLRRRTRIKS